MWHLWLIYHRNVVDVVHFCDNNWSSANFDVTTLEKFFVYRWRHPGILDVVTDAPAEPVDSCCTVHCMLPQTTSNMGLIILMSVTDDQFLSFLHGRLLYLGLLLFSFYLLFSPFLLCSSFCLNLYKVGNNYVSPTHCCIFSGINWVVYSFLYWAVNLSEKLLYFCKTVTKFCSLVACIEWRQRKHTFAY